MIIKEVVDEPDIEIIHLEKMGKKNRGNAFIQRR
jgi:hypothetical protein